MSKPRQSSRVIPPEENSWRNLGEAVSLPDGATADAVRDFGRRAPGSERKGRTELMAHRAPPFQRQAYWTIRLRPS
jgi:hypothetical protein